MIRHNRTQNRKGFTLIEILIVVIILGILAAIVIPQFTNASKEAKQSSLVTMVQSLRSQIALFKLQHNDMLPGAAPLKDTGGSFTEATFWDQLTLFSKLDGTTAAAKNTATGFVYGPYMQSIPANPLVTPANASKVNNAVFSATAAAGAGYGFIYDYNDGSGSGKVWGVDASDNMINQ